MKKQKASEMLAEFMTEAERKGDWKRQEKADLAKMRKRPVLHLTDTREIERLVERLGKNSASDGQGDRKTGDR